MDWECLMVGLLGSGSCVGSVGVWLTVFFG